MSEYEEALQADIEEYERALDRKQDRIEELYRGLLEAEEYMDKEERKIHNTNLKKMEALNKQETEEWKKKWLR